jgi:hypothetical protein
VSSTPLGVLSEPSGERCLFVRRSLGRARCAVRRRLLSERAARRTIMCRRQTVMSWSCWTFADSRFLAMASSKGHIATFDWQAGKLNAEIQLRESVRDIK